MALRRTASEGLSRTSFDSMRSVDTVMGKIARCENDTSTDQINEVCWTSLIILIADAIIWHNAIN